MAKGTVPARFVTLAKLASGGTATVYVGTRADGAGGLVAIKCPHPHVLEDARQRAALLREADIASTLDHPNLVRVLAIEETAEAGRELELVLDYVDGAALGTLLVAEARRGGRMPPAVAVRIVLDACAGLAAVHARGLVHRDVSPQNILVGVDGLARVTDFGLAKALYEGAPSTTQGTLKGKLGYMAPEYVSRSRLSAGVDVFALGVVLWEALATSRLFRGDNEAQTLDRVLREDAPPLATVVDASLAPFDPVIASAVAKEPEARYASAEAFGVALADAAARSGMLASPAEVGAYVAAATGDELRERAARIAEARAALARRRSRRRAWIAVALGAPVVAVAATGGFIALRPHRMAAAGMPSTVSMSLPPPTTTAATPNPPASEGSASSEAAVLPPPAPPRDSRPAPTTRPAHVPPPNPYVHRGATAPR